MEKIEYKIFKSEATMSELVIRLEKEGCIKTPTKRRRLVVLPHFLV